MTKKQTIVFSIAIVAIVAIYYYLYRDSFGPKVIHISHSFRDVKNRKPDGQDDEDNNSVIFSLFNKYKLNSVKVVSCSELATNQYAHPLWELTTDSNSVPTKIIIYGRGIGGMHPAVKGAKAEPLELDVQYRLIVKSGEVTASHDFKLGEESHVAQ